MRTVVICGSRRYKDGIRSFAEELRKRGVVVFEPFLNEKKILELEEDLRKYAFLGLTLHHLEYIKKADVVFIFNKDGYMGNSSTLELGAAVALSKPIFALEHDKDEKCRDILFDRIVKTYEELVDLLK